MNNCLKNGIGVVLLLLSFPVRSEIKKHSFELTPFYAYNLFDKNQNLKDTTSYGARISYNPWFHFGFEASLEILRSRIKDTNFIPPTGGFSELLAPDGVDIKFYYLDFIYSIFSNKNWTPLLFLGYGGASYDPKIETQDLPLLIAGAGVKYELHDSVALRLDAKDMYVSDLFSNGFHNVNLSIGLQIRLNPYEHEQILKHEQVLKTHTEQIRKETKLAIHEKAKESKQKRDHFVEVREFFFAYASSRLNANSKVNLNKLIKLLKRQTHLSVRISGSASAAGDKRYNKLLAENRAIAVHDYLMDIGHISAHRLHLVLERKGKGSVKEHNPKNKNSPEAVSNRRVLLEIYSEKP